MADIGHCEHTRTASLYLNNLAAIQITFSFVRIKICQADGIDIAEEEAMNYCTGPWEDKRIPQGGFDPLKSTERCIDPSQTAYQ